MRFEFIADEHVKVKTFLKRHEISKGLLAKIKFSGGNILVNHQPQNAVYLLDIGDRVTIDIPSEKGFESLKAVDKDLSVIYEDEHFLVLDKPAGVASIPSVNHSNTMANFVKAYYIRQGYENQQVHIVTRLDKDTSGLLMVAKTDRAHISLSGQLYEHTIVRRYYALVQDNFRQDEGTIDLPIGRDGKNRLKKTVNGLNSKKAVTHFRVMERFGDYTLVECRLETGRTHQIRVHMAYIKHPLVGDPIYGSKKRNFNTDGQLLHAAVLGFVHPVTGEYMEFKADIPEEFEKILNKLRNENQ